jgi:hypothetical protein
MSEAGDRAASDEQARAAPYRPEDFTKLQPVSPTPFQRMRSHLKIVLLGIITSVPAFCGRLAGVA